MNRRDIKLPREAKIQFRAVPSTIGSSIDYRLEYRVDPEDDKYRYKEDVKSIFFGLIKIKNKIDYSNYWLNTHIFTGYCPEEQESHYMNWSLGIKIKDKDQLNKYKNAYKNIAQFENYLNIESNRNYDIWKIKHEKFIKQSKEILY